MNIHQTTAHAEFLRSIGWTIETRQYRQATLYAFIRRLPLVPVSLMKLQRIPLESLDWAWVKDLERKYHVYETLLEIDELTQAPDTPVIAGFTPAADFMLTTKTRIIDLTQDEGTLLQAMKPKQRYNIHLAEKRGLTPTIWSTGRVARDRELFERVYEMLHANAKRIHMLLLPKAWMKKQFQSFGEAGWVVGILSPQKGLVNVAVFYTSDTTCSYNHNGSTETGRKLMGPTLAVWVGMQEGKRRGLTVFDFDGVFDERYPERQQRFHGFGRFKAGFGGSEQYFYPMYRRRRWPL